MSTNDRIFEAENIEILTAIYKGVWKLPSYYMDKLTRRFILNISKEQFVAALFDTHPYKDQFEHSSTLWEVGYYECDTYTLYNLPTDAKLIISMREIKPLMINIALVAIYNPLINKRGLD